MKVIQFSDKLHADAHSQFQAWRRKNPNGFVLALKKQKQFTLHEAACEHLDDDGSESADWSLTKKPKFCCVDRAALRKWAREKQAYVTDCPDCI